MGAATVMVLAAGGPFQGAASPFKAAVSIFIDTAAGAAFRTSVRFVANRGRLYWRWRRWAGIGGILTLLNRVGRFHC